MERLRVTAFPSPMAQVQEPTWWSDLVGEPPETRTTRPRQGSSQEAGTVTPGKLILNIEPTRIQWLLTATDEEKLNEAGAPPIGTFSDVLQVFQKLIECWFTLKTCPAMIRLAFGAVLLQPATSLQDAYQRLGRYLPSVTLDPVGSSDFLYQINRQRNSTTEMADLKMNRLSQWDAARFVTATFSTNPERISYHQRPVFVRLGLDMNTAPDFQGEFEQGQSQQAVFSELVRLGCEIASQGDIP